MIYPYECPSCHQKFEVIKSVKYIDAIEVCPGCEVAAERRIGRPYLCRVNDWVESYNPAFGCVVKSKAHQREILSRYKDKGKEFIEIGNEPVENVHKHFDSQRAERDAKRWGESPEKLLYETMNE
jgi:putative FmdB family regulatory protein